MKLYTHMTHMYLYPIAKFSRHQKGLDERYRHLNTNLNIQFVNFPRCFRKRAPIYLERSASDLSNMPKNSPIHLEGELRLSATIIQNAGAIPAQPNKEPCNSDVINRIP